MRTSILIIILMCVGMSFSSPFTKGLEKLGYTDVISLKESPESLQGNIIATTLMEDGAPKVFPRAQLFGYVGKDSVAFIGTEQPYINIASGFGPNRMTHYTFFGGDKILMLITPVTDSTLQPFGRFYCEVFFYDTNQWIKFFWK